ncbi:MAG: hypothetical protein IJC95_03720 [Clostridia bacterium]|nr:hypothetical protein [Clostridia bacterium]
MKRQSRFVKSVLVARRHHLLRKIDRFAHLRSKYCRLVRQIPVVPQRSKAAEAAEPLRQGCLDG